MKDTDSKRLVFTLQGLPTGVFGETYVVVTGVELAPKHYLTEQFIFTQRPDEALDADSLEIDGRTLPDELETVDLDYVLREGVTQANANVLRMLERRASDLERPELAYGRYELVPRPSPFVGCKMRGRFVPQLSEMKAKTQCPSFSRYLRLLEQVSVVSRN
ncbi:hypothetical protein GJ700_02930 [Duganella sp. FT92W]|uniref:Uncharacterized protein n=1 Tax=Pseudoduganella rivuli TaxID=2666085 RepID=A0A7X2IJF7_9BURK|nr:hypothetical protein [Pseudoduganella rivuli]MRV70672.1 hypothetical protein [Pseudoduganella rivuli]